MKKFKMSTSIIIIVVSVVVIVGGFWLVSNYLGKDDEPTEIEISAVQDVLLRNMETDYPPTPKEVVKYYSEITKCFYAGGYTDDELIELADRAVELYDAELVANQDYDTYIKNLKAEIKDYKNKNWSISSYSTSSSVEVDEFTRDGYKWAQLYAFYNMRQSSSIVRVTEQFLLRQDEDGRWKIFGWQQVSDEK